MENLTKESVKTRLIVAFVLGVVCTCIMLGLHLFDDAIAIVVILAPLLFTWSFATVFFFPKEWVENSIKPAFKIWLPLLCLRFGEVIKILCQSTIYSFKMLIRSIKLIFWAFSKQ